jgi:predicted AAA+ superfamily ATPase
MMVAHYHAQTWNASELARSFGVAHTTGQRYLDVLTETFMIRQLQPWHENVGKRQVKAPRLSSATAGRCMRCWRDQARELRQ